jgi:hypothetical protein
MINRCVDTIHLAFQAQFLGCPLVTCGVNRSVSCCSGSTQQLQPLKSLDNINSVSRKPLPCHVAWQESFFRVSFAADDLPPPGAFPAAFLTDLTFGRMNAPATMQFLLMVALVCLALSGEAHTV